VSYTEKVYNGGDYIERLLDDDVSRMPLEELFDLLKKTAEGLAEPSLAFECDPSDHPDYSTQHYFGIGGRPLPGDEDKWKAKYAEQWK
jgi:hypothetical protein